MGCGPSTNQVVPYDEERCDCIFLGLEGAGKTLLTRRLQSLYDKQRLINFTQNTWPTTGVEICIIKGQRHGCFRLLRTRELGGCMAPIWPKYYSDAQSLVYLLDASKPDTWQEAGRKLHETLLHEHMQGKPCLVVLNKLDACSHKPLNLTSQVQQLLGWAQLSQEHDMTMVLASALMGHGVERVTEWLIEVKSGLRPQVEARGVDPHP